MHEKILAITGSLLLALPVYAQEQVTYPDELVGQWCVDEEAPSYAGPMDKSDKGCSQLPLTFTKTSYTYESDVTCKLDKIERVGTTAWETHVVCNFDTRKWEYVDTANYERIEIINGRLFFEPLPEG